MKFIRLADQQCPFDLAEVLATRPNAIFPAEAKYIDFAELGFAVVVDGARPEIDETTQQLELGPVECQNDVWTQTFTAVARPQEQIDLALEQQKLQQYQHGKSVVELFLNRAAQEREYDTIQSAALRAAFPGPYQEEGIAFGVWMDLCWRNFYALTASAQAAGQAFPSDEDIITSMVPLVLPAPPVV